MQGKLVKVCKDVPWIQLALDKIFNNFQVYKEDKDVQRQGDTGSEVNYPEISELENKWYITSMDQMKITLKSLVVIRIILNIGIRENKCYITSMGVQQNLSGH